MILRCFRVVLICLLWGLAFSPVAGQRVKFGATRQRAEVAVNPGAVWVKLKGNYRNILSSSSSRMPGTGALSVRPFVKNAFSKTGRIAPKKATVDIDLYYTITCDPSTPVYDFITQLNETGYFEKIEPIYSVEPLFTPDDPGLTQQSYLNLIRAPQAWDITKGDESMVIAIVDTGGDLDHPDLQSKLFYNTADPIDGIDNDNDGFTDNYSGWDFSGAEQALIGTPGFIGDNDPSINKANLFSHGTMVAGCAAASTNNGAGIASVGYNTKLMFTKHFSDDQADTGTGYTSNLYDGILYAATHGAKIINCSWGGYNASTIAQDIINYVTFDLGCLIVAAAGNSNIENSIYPASYDNVLSVGSTDINDVRTYFSNFGKNVDIVAPGDVIYTTYYNDGYTTDSGTSLSTPIVSGAAALVWAQHPLFTPLQVAEQLRISADESIYSKNASYLHKLGRGRLDVEKALTLQSPSIRASNQQLVNDTDTAPQPGQQTKLLFDFTNYLAPSSGALKATLSSSSPYISITGNTLALGLMGENSTVGNAASAFELTLLPTLPIDEVIELLITYEDGDYIDYQLVNIVLPSYIDIRENNIITSLAPGARIGWGQTDSQDGGSGFMYGEEQLLYEMGIIMGTSASTIVNNVRGTSGFDNDFVDNVALTKSTPGNRSYSEVQGSVRDAEDPASANIQLSYQSLVWKNDPYRDFVIIEYKVKNSSDADMNDFYFGIFADWDLINNGGGDRAGWDPVTKTGYVYPAQPAYFPQTGIQALTGAANYFAIDNDPSVPGNPFGIYDGFTDDEKFDAISGGTAKIQAGNAVTGSDVSHVVASGPYSIPAGGEITIAFALHANYTHNGLINSARYADSLYNYTLKAQAPVVSGLETCYGDPAQIEASGGSKFKWYTEFTGGAPVFEGAEFETADLTSDTVFYVSNASNSFESIRTKATVTIRSNPVISASGPTAFCEGDHVELSTEEGEEYKWSNDADQQAIQVSVSGEYNVVVRNGELSCSSVPVQVTVHEKPSADFSITPEVPVAGEPAVFSAIDDSAVSWAWDFGDGGTSASRNPIHVYDEVSEYTIVLSVISAEDCMNTASSAIGPVTGIEKSSRRMSMYPNPVRNDQVYVDVPEGMQAADAYIINAVGKVVKVNAVASGQTSIDVSQLVSGTYVLQLRSGHTTIERKLVIIH